VQKVEERRSKVSGKKKKIGTSKNLVRGNLAGETRTLFFKGERGYLKKENKCLGATGIPRSEQKKMENVDGR